MGRRPVTCLNLVLCLGLLGGCSSSPVSKPVRRGAKINLTHLREHPEAYQGKTLTLTLTVAERIDRGQGQSLRQYANRYVNFTADGPNGERLSLVIRIPENISIPEAAQGDEVVVTFLCSRGHLRQGNEATAVEPR
jgi:hypothetical protein